MNMLFNWSLTMTQCLFIFRIRKAPGQADNRVFIPMAHETCQAVTQEKGLSPTDSHMKIIKQQIRCREF